MKIMSMWRVLHWLFGWHYVRIYYFGRPYILRIYFEENGVLCKGRDGLLRPIDLDSKYVEWLTRKQGTQS